MRKDDVTISKAKEALRMADSHDRCRIDGVVLSDLILLAIIGSNNKPFGFILRQLLSRKKLIPALSEIGLPVVDDKSRRQIFWISGDRYGASFKHRHELCGLVIDALWGNKDDFPDNDLTRQWVEDIADQLIAEGAYTGEDSSIYVSDDHGPRND